MIRCTVRFVNKSCGDNALFWIAVQSCMKVGCQEYDVVFACVSEQTDSKLRFYQLTK